VFSLKLFYQKKLIEKFGGSIELFTKQANSENKDIALGWNIFTLTFINTYNSDKNAFI
jgi:hypothetical protein